VSDRLRLLLLSLAALPLLLLAGSEAAAYVAQAAVDPKIPALYDIEDRPTLIVVDDPRKLMGDPAMTGVIADQISLELRQGKALKTVIDPLKLRDEQIRLGDAYEATALDQLGRTLGAEQVIHVQVEDVQLQGAPGVLKPRGLTRVKLIDTQKGKRLFPPAQTGEAKSGVSPQPRGQPVLSELFYQQLSQDTRAELNRVVRELAVRMGRDAAYVFYDHPKRPVGAGFDP
jgi:hypothetical protein